MNLHFDPAPSVIVGSYNFNSRLQCAGNFVTNFSAELHSLAKYCNYVTLLDEMLHDRILCSIQGKGIQQNTANPNEGHRDCSDNKDCSQGCNQSIDCI